MQFSEVSQHPKSQCLGLPPARQPDRTCRSWVLTSQWKTTAQIDPTQCENNT
jgi:hypothetical protein